MPDKYSIVQDNGSNAIFDNETGKIIAWIANTERAEEIVRKVNAKIKSKEEIYNVHGTETGRFKSK